MKHIKLFETFINEDGPIWDKMKSVYQDAKKGISSRFGYGPKLTKEQTKFLNDYTRGEWKVNPDTGLIDVRGEFNCMGENLNDFKGLRFGKVTKDFNCNYNNLKTLDGSPREVGENFGCRKNPLISLEGAPSKVGGRFAFDNLDISQFHKYKIWIEYNLASFLEAIKEDITDTPLLLTHHFFTPEVIKHNLEEDDKFCIAVGRAWNREGFKNKRIILENPLNPNGLSPETLQKIKDFSAIRGYL
jgi:hypothetical protein